jgi:uncharacterized membrane protein
MKITRIVGWLFLFVGLMTLLLPGSTLAAETKTDLTIRLIGDYYSQVKAGEDNKFFLELRNSGNRTLTDIRLSSDKAEGWVIEFNPAQISSLNADSIQTIDINIRPPAKTSRGDYKFSVIAQANEIKKVETIWLRVESDSFWLWVGAIVGAVVVAGFIIIFIRFGRK